MKKAILTVLMVLMLVIPAYAADGESIPDTPHDETQFVVSTWEELQTAVANGWIADRADFIPDAIISRGELEQLINSVLNLYRV